MVSSLADVNTLVAALGTNAFTVGIWDDRVNVTASSGNVTSWADCRTVGPGPTINYFGSGTHPTWAGAGQPVTTIASGASMLTATSATFNAAGPSSVVFVMASSDTSTNAMAAVNGTALCAISGGTTDYIGIFGNAQNPQDAGVASGATIRCIVLTVASGGASATVQVANHAVQTKSGITSTVANGALVLGSGGGVSGIAIAAQFYAVLYFNAVLSASQVTTITNWAIANHSAVAAS